MRARTLSAVAVCATLVFPAAASGAAPTVDHVRVAARDGVSLDGWVVRPAGTHRSPVVLWSAPYFGQCRLNASLFAPPEPRCRYGAGDDPELWDNSTSSEAVPVAKLLERGYAVAMFSVRGTGNSGGCFEYFGRREQLDQYDLVEWLARQEWSSGDVAMMGLSYHGTTPLEAAIHRPPHLRAIVVGGIVSDAYGFNFSPQGATLGGAMYDVFHEDMAVSASLAPPVGGGPDHATTGHAHAGAERACPELVRFTTAVKRGGFAADRDSRFWRERRLIRRFGRIKAPVLLAHGLKDLWGSGHKFAAQDVWPHLRTRVEGVVGQWGHTLPNFSTVKPLDDWDERVFAWLDRWVRDRKRPGRGSRIDWQDDRGVWHRSRTWPPPSRAHSVPVTGSFVALPQLAKLGVTEDLLCSTPDAGVVVLGEPLAVDTLIAGNPTAELSLESDQPGGQVSANVFDVSPEFACSASGTASGARRLTLGAADLRFHHGGLRPQAYPVGRPDSVSIDLANLAAVVPRGHRIGVVISFGEPSEYETFPHIASRLKLHPGSRVVLPLVRPAR